jgi:Icc-related predicted phosphoesterase
MRCHYLSDLHLEAQSFGMALPKGDVLTIAGDLCHARCLDPARTDSYSVAQRDRAMRLIDEALRKFPHVLLIAGNHEHYDGVFDETPEHLRRHLPGVTVLDDEAVQIGGVRFFGSTLWTDLSGQTEPEVTAIRKGMGEYFFVKTRGSADQPLAKLRPADTHKAHEIAWARLREVVASEPQRPTVVITHHAPSRLGLNPRFTGNPLDPAYASSLDEEIAAFVSIGVEL